LQNFTKFEANRPKIHTIIHNHSKVQQKTSSIFQPSGNNVLEMPPTIEPEYEVIRISQSCWNEEIREAEFLTYYSGITIY